MNRKYNYIMVQELPFENCGESKKNNDEMIVLFIGQLQYIRPANLQVILLIKIRVSRTHNAFILCRSVVLCLLWIIRQGNEVILFMDSLIGYVLTCFRFVPFSFNEVYHFRSSRTSRTAGDCATHQSSKIYRETESA